MHLAHIDINFTPGGGQLVNQKNAAQGNIFVANLRMQKKTRHKARGKACVACRNMIFICCFGGKPLHTTAGQVIGYVGNTGDSTGFRLHLGVMQGGVEVNPLDMLFPQLEWWGQVMKMKDACSQSLVGALPIRYPLRACLCYRLNR